MRFQLYSAGVLTGNKAVAERNKKMTKNVLTGAMAVGLGISGVTRAERG